MFKALTILINVAIASPSPTPCIYPYSYDTGEKDTHCLLIHTYYEYLDHGDFIDDAMVVLDCTQGITNLGKRLTGKQLPIITTIRSKCLEPSRLDLIIINKIYKKNLKFYKTHPISNYIKRR